MNMTCEINTNIKIILHEEKKPQRYLRFKISDRELFKFPLCREDSVKQLYRDENNDVFHIETRNGGDIPLDLTALLQDNENIKDVYCIYR